MNDQYRETFEIYKKLKDGTATDEEIMSYKLYVATVCQKEEFLLKSFERLIDQEKLNNTRNRKDP